MIRLKLHDFDGRDAHVLLAQDQDQRYVAQQMFVKAGK
jgi:hypothetical protein